MLSLGVCFAYFLKMLINSLSLDESSCGLSGTAALAGVDRLGVVGREVGVEPVGVV